MTAAGYNASEKIYLDTDYLNLAPVPEHPSDEELLRALELIEELLCDFRFAQPSDLAHAHALLLTPIVQPLIDGVSPMFDIEGPIAGSGKGLLAHVLTYPSVGHAPPMAGEPTSEVEFQKLVTSILAAGASHIFLDNIRRPVTFGAWAKGITNPIFQERLLGGNRKLEVPMRLVWVMTANNPSFSNEMARRTIRIRLDPGVEHPDERVGFKHPELTIWAADHRSDILHALLTIVQHWVSQGCPPGQRPLGAFERWAKILGGILASAGIAGFLENRLQAVAIADSETAAWRELLSEWHVQHADGAVSAKDLFPIAKEIAGIFLGRGKEEHAQVVTFGIGLGRRRDQIFTITLADDKTQVSVKLESAGIFRRALRWKLTIVA